jgi:hypothetical protein
LSSKFTSITNSNPLFIIYLVAVVVLTAFNCTPALESFDTAFYLRAGEKLWHGEMDCLRTPVYPLLLKVCSMPGDGRWLHLLMTLLQSGVYLLSVYFFYDLLRRLVHKEGIAFWVTLFYVLLPAAGWCNELLTESLSISLMIILTHQLVCFLQHPKWQCALWACLLLLVMVMLRPNFIAFFAILLVIWIWQWIATKEHIYALALAFLLIPMSGYWGYCKAFENKYGLFSASAATLSCDLYNLTRSETWDITCLTDSNEIALCRALEAKQDPSYVTTFNMIESTHNTKTLASACKVMKEHHQKEYMEYKAEVFITSWNSQFMPAVNTHTTLSTLLFFLSGFIAIHLSLMYLFIFFLAMALICHICGQKKIPILIVLLWCIVAAQCVGIPLKGSDSYARLLMPAYPVFLCLLGWGLDKVMRTYEERIALKK